MDFLLTRVKLMSLILQCIPQKFKQYLVIMLILGSMNIIPLAEHISELHLLILVKQLILKLAIANSA